MQPRAPSIIGPTEVASHSPTCSRHLKILVAKLSFSEDVCAFSWVNVFVEGQQCASGTEALEQIFELKDDLP